ncbi:MAG: penicillin-binding protein 2 [bacterium]|nr:penicillin-binding protein 2 [bacterium]
MPFISLQTSINPRMKEKLQSVIFVFCIFFIILIFYLAYLQLIKGKDFLEQAKYNRVRIAYIRAPRGLILDRNHKLLASNSVGYSLYITMEDAKNKEAELKKNLTKLFDVEKENFDLIYKNRMIRPYQSQLLLKNISKKQLIIFEENKNSLPGISVRLEPLRFYPSEGICHIIGYLSEVNESKLKDPSGNYDPGDLAGQGGLEQAYDNYLRGGNGREEIEVDAWGRKTKVLAMEDPVKGANLVTTLDLGLQALAEDLLKNRKGAVVALNPANGEVLALVSSPKYDPNIFIGGVTVREWKKLINNPDLPLLNRAIQGQYPPGSTMKPIVSVGALSDDMDNAKILNECTGEFPIKDKVFRCWKKDGHGKVDMGHAIRYSCNIFFYKLGLKLGAKKLINIFKEFNFGNAAGIDIYTEKAGLISEHSQWFPGNTAQLAIGQGYILATPLQLAIAYSALANGGTIYRPFMVSKVISYDNKILKEFAPVELKKIDFPPEAFNMVRSYLWQAVNGSGGTGVRARIPGLDVSGKTGTAQLVARPMDEEEEKRLPAQLRPHAWFACFAPMKNPKICLVILVEHGGEGGTSAAPIAKELISYYLKDEPRNFDMEIN